MLSQEAIEAILAIKEKTALTPKEMAKSLSITFFPHKKEDVSQEIIAFEKELMSVLKEIGVKIIPYKDSLEKTSLFKIFHKIIKIGINNFIFLFEKYVSKIEPMRQYIVFGVIQNLFVRDRVKAGISIIASGDFKTGCLPMDKASSFSKTSIVTILDMPKGINNETNFATHFDTSMSLFAYHMSNIVIAVDKENWLLYNFNASHPIFKRGAKTFKKDVLDALISKIAAPIRPHTFKEFEVLNESFDPKDAMHAKFANDLVDSGKIFQKSGLYPAGKKISSLPFRNEYYMWIGRLHLDGRNGMSYGFLARQLPAKLSQVMTYEDAKNKFPESIDVNKDYFYNNGNLYIVLELSVGKYCLEVPEAWTLTQRSGSDKTNFNLEKDLVKMGLKNGKMYLQPTSKFKLDSNFKTSFDTKVILAHSVGNVICASVLEYLKPGTIFAKSLKENGLALSHWHGYINPKYLPEGWHVHGAEKPHVSCSSPQSAVYALQGKLETLDKVIKEDKVYSGDVHIEPHHGSNMTHFSLVETAEFFTKNSDTANLGNKYLEYYK